MKPVSVKEGTVPLVLAIPHCSTWMPQNAAKALNENGRRFADTDWHVDRLYDGLAEEASVVRANFSRYLIDANRDPGGTSLYPDRNTTTLCPLTDFSGCPIHRNGMEPNEAAIADRLHQYHVRYHDALAAEIERVRRRHGLVILYDCHSIRSKAPYLFEGTLPDINIGTNSGMSCAPVFEEAVVNICARAPSFSHVTNGRFKGGWTTRHYGRPDAGFHAIQIELAQRTYLKAEAPPFAYDEMGAEQLRAVLSNVLEALVALAERQSMAMENRHEQPGPKSAT